MIYYYHHNYYFILFSCFVYNSNKEVKQTGAEVAVAEWIRRPARRLAVVATVAAMALTKRANNIKRPVPGSPFTKWTRPAARNVKNHRLKKNERQPKRSPLSSVCRLVSFYSNLFFFRKIFSIWIRMFINCINRRVPNLLGAVLHVQHHGRHLHEIRTRLSAGRNGFPADHLVGLRQFVHQSRHLHHFQPRVP